MLQYNQIITLLARCETLSINDIAVAKSSISSHSQLPIVIEDEAINATFSNVHVDGARYDACSQSWTIFDSLNGRYVKVRFLGPNGEIISHDANNKRHTS